jgi:hypothetical protein
MVSIEQLEALDLLLWYRSGNSASEHGLCNQSSISRRVRSALQVFDLKLRRNHEFRLHGDQRLLQAQRYVHQLARFIGASKRPLRLEATHYICNQLIKPAVPGWVLGPCHHRGYETLLSMLRERIIDAWISSDLQDLPESPEFTVIRLWDWPGDLIVNHDHPLVHEKGLSQADLDRFPSLTMPTDLYPALARVIHAKGFGHHRQLARYDQGSWLGLTKDAVTISYGGCLSLDGVPTLRSLDWDLGLVGGEALIVLSEWANQAAIALLLEDLRTRQLGLQQRFPQLYGRL